MESLLGCLGDVLRIVLLLMFLVFLIVFQACESCKGQARLSATPLPTELVPRPAPALRP